MLAAGGGTGRCAARAQCTGKRNPCPFTLGTLHPTSAAWASAGWVTDGAMSGSRRRCPPHRFCCKAQCSTARQCKRSKHYRAALRRTTQAAQRTSPAPPTALAALPRCKDARATATNGHRPAHDLGHAVCTRCKHRWRQQPTPHRTTTRPAAPLQPPPTCPGLAATATPFKPAALTHKGRTANTYPPNHP